MFLGDVDLLRSIIYRVLRRLKVKPKIPSSLTLEDGSTFAIAHGTTILQVAKANDIDLDHFCGGTCSCSTCVIEVISGLQHMSKMEPRERLVLGDDKSKKGMRLACQAKIYGPVQIKIPKWF